MSLPISVGDVILLAQIAWGIGQAFTSGHRAAPAEFKEIQDLLFTLSEALKLLARDFPNNNEVAQVTRAEEEGLENESEADSALLAQMIMNCRSTLTHLKAMVDKYMELDKSSGQNEQKKWKNEVKKNWKMLLWTREGGDIIKLKTTLTAHINGLNLALAAINKRYGSEVKDHVEYMHTKLDDIYEWFKQYLEGRRAETAPRSPQHRSSTEEANDDRLYFAVAVHIMLGREDRKLICPRAAFRDEWLDEDDPFRIAPSIFQCCCSRSSASDGHTETLHVSLLPSSILVQVAIQGSESPCWHMYAASRNSPHRSSSVYISKVEPTKLQDLEAAAHRLSLVQARQHVMRNQSTSLVSFNTTMDSSASDGVVSVLASKTDHITHEEEGRCTISFRVGERQFSASVDVAYSVLHYKSMPESVVRTTSRETLTRRTEDFSRDGDHLASIIALEVHQPHAEVLFQGSRQGPSGDRGSTYYITFYHDTSISQGSGPRFIRISNVLVMSEQKKDSSIPPTVQQIKCDAVDIEFGDSIDAQTLLSSLQSMQSNLFHLYLSLPLFGEHILFHRVAGDMIVRDHLLPSATLSLVYTPESDAYRIILLADTRAVSVCMPLSARQLEALMTDQSAGSKEHPAYFLVRDMEGTEVVRESVRLDELIPGGKGVGLHPLFLMKATNEQRRGGMMITAD